jgi:hypothetical protein
MTQAVSPILLSISPTTVEVKEQPTLKFELTLQNVSGKPLTLKGGEPVPESKQPNGPSSLYLTTTGLFDTEQAEDLKIHASGWNSACYTEGPVTWALCPSSDLTLAPNESVGLTIGHGVVSGPPRPAQITIDYYLPEEDEGTRALPLMVEGESGPPAPVTAALLDSRVFPTLDSSKLVQNTLYLTLANTSGQPLATTWPSETPPHVNLSFLCSQPPGYGALTTAPHAQAISVNAVPQQAARWKIEQRPEGPFPYWVIEPSQGNPQILGTGAEATLELAISNLITEFPVTAPDPTLVSLQLVAFPGYGDSWLKAPIVKVPGTAP